MKPIQYNQNTKTTFKQQIPKQNNKPNKHKHQLIKHNQATKYTKHPNQTNQPKSASQTQTNSKTPNQS